MMLAMNQLNSVFISLFLLFNVFFWGGAVKNNLRVKKKKLHFALISLKMRKFIYSDYCSSSKGRKKKNAIYRLSKFECHSRNRLNFKAMVIFRLPFAFGKRKIRTNYIK